MVQRFTKDYARDLSDIFRNPESVGTIAEILSTLAIWAGQASFKEALSDWSKSLGNGAATRDVINVIPYGKPVACKELLMVFSTGKCQFDTRMREAHDHCAIDCPGITKDVLFITDFWDNEKFWDIRASTYEKLAAKYGVVLAAAIWTGKSFALKQIVP